MKYLFLLMIFISSIFAHPHTFVDVYPTIKTKNNQITHIKYKWVFDDMTSSMLLMEFDTNGNGKIDKDENDYIYENYFLPLGDYNFYTDIVVNGKVQKFPKIKIFQASILDNKIIYEFIINKKINPKDTYIEIGDKDFFVAMVLKKKYVTSDIKYKVSDVDNEFYFGYKLEFK